MKSFLINPLSVGRQCADMASAEVAIRGVLDCIDHISPALAEGRAQVFFDVECEASQLLTNEPFAQTLGSLSGSKGADVRRRWYQYTRNKARKVQGERFDGIVRAVDDATLSTAGLLPEEAKLTEAFFSFGGSELMHAPLLDVVSDDGVKCVGNACCETSVKSLMPIYRASPKHGASAYFDAQRNVWVAPMTLNHTAAQRLLIGALFWEGDYFGYERGLRKLVRFKPTIGNEFHGFEIERAELPVEVERKLFR